MKEARSNNGDAVAVPTSRPETWLRLKPRLARTYVELFQHPGVNTHFGFLLCQCHEVYF